MDAFAIEIAGTIAARRGSRRQWRASAPTSARSSLGQPELARDGPDHVARYIEEMTTELASMARAANLDLLAYFLSIAHAESEAIIEACMAGV